MQPFDLELLLVPGLVIFFGTLWVAYRVTHSTVFSLVAAFLKAGLFLIYFGMLFDGTFTFLDDWRYLEGGQELYAQGVGIINLAENWELALFIGGGDHFVYYLFNTYAFHLFGEGYYAPVAMNILVTLLVAWFGTRLAAQEFNLGRTWGRWFFAFLLFHPDILAWSNIMNGKDVFVLLLHVLLLISCSLLFRRRLAAALVLAVPVALLLFFMRFYVPLLFALALFASLLLGQKGKEYLHLFLLGGALVALVLAWLGPDGMQYALAALREHFVNPFYGFVRFVMTPIPFNTEPAYSFLDLPAFIHWAFSPFACWGAVVVYRLRTPFTRFFLLYVLVFVGLYAMFGELQGPRHRVQLDYAWACFQFMGVMTFLQFHFDRRRQMLVDHAAARLPSGDSA